MIYVLEYSYLYVIYTCMVTINPLCLAFIGSRVIPYV